MQEHPIRLTALHMQAIRMALAEDIGRLTGTVRTCVSVNELSATHQCAVHALEAYEKMFDSPLGQDAVASRYADMSRQLRNAVIAWRITHTIESSKLPAWIKDMSVDRSPVRRV
jgi:hypothetical protein